MTAAPTALAEILQRAGMNPRQLAAAVNAWLEGRGLGARRIDPTAPYAWVRHGYKPYEPLPSVVAAVLSEQLGYAIPVDQLWPDRQAAAVSAASGLGQGTTIDGMLASLSELTTVSTGKHADVTAASGPDLAAVVLDGLHVTLTLTRRGASRERVLAPQVELIGAHVAALRKLDDRHGGGVLSLRYVTSELRNILDLVQSADYEPAVGRELLTAVADLAQLVGWVHFDAHRYGAAERYLLLSERVARGLGELGRAANAIGMLAYISAFAGHGREAVQIATAAERSCPSDPVLRARIVGRVATAAAAAGDLAEFREASEKARELLSSAQDSPTYLYYMEPAQLIAEAGQALVVLGESATIYRKRLLGEAIALLAPISQAGARPEYPRSAMLHGVFLTKAYLLRGEVEPAIGAARATLSRLSEVQSIRGITYLRRLRPAFARRSRSPVVSEFLPEFDKALMHR
ncbi:hypothetical protein [Spongiactinospora sp. TRM90649]|uniref:hypothetical protein n=1 Tax=Spongiactinospora sp. TRM90649 TaxID=3031114 RepID=UPI0023F92C0F|nr:hypothetical protein [Spongiactinospora sp. TRM90649]MDF5759027.1 hypothetical protein [Spongiactinospora sp. TRM90649]